jgi:hypothetical protein
MNSARYAAFFRSSPRNHFKVFEKASARPNIELGCSANHSPKICENALAREALSSFFGIPLNRQSPQLKPLTGLPNVPLLKLPAAPRRDLRRPPSRPW